MNQVFHRSMNSLVRGGIFALIFIGGAAGAILYEFQSTPYIMRVTVPIEQPVPFSHKHHVAGVGIDCRYCHASAEKSTFAGIPSTQTCMTCHSGLWTNAAQLEPIRESERTGSAIRWTRVNDLPDFVYFDHSIHLSKGVGCESCHGDLAKMPLVARDKTLTMAWCLDCHRNPEKFIRPREEMTNIYDYKSGHASKEGKDLVMKYKVHPLTDCSTCHR